MPQPQTLFSPPWEPLSSLLPGEGGAPRVGGAVLCGDFSGLSRTKSLFAKCMRASWMPTAIHSNWENQDHLQRGEPRGGKEATTTRITPRGSQEPGTRVCRNFASAPFWVIWSPICVPRATGVKTLNKGGGEAQYVSSV